MSDRTKIEWADATANYVNGCTVVSPGCTNCYAMRLAGTRFRDHPSRAGLTVPTKAGPVWTGKVRQNKRVLQTVRSWKKPRLIFWNAHGDLFHPAVPDSWVDAQFVVMAATPQHIHMVLTKRPERMLRYVGALHYRGARQLPNLWLGTSVEDQARADKRIRYLLATPAAVRFISAEPLLEPVVIPDIAHIDWVIVGGESGPGARDWPGLDDSMRAIRDQCAAAGVAFFCKQMAGVRKPLRPIPDDLLIREMPG